MKHFYLYIFILSIFIILMAYFNSKRVVERFDNNKTYVLMGDSILKNNAYVADGKSIETLITERNNKIFSFAEDNSKISDIFIQVNNLPIKLNNPNTYIFLCWWK